MASSTQLDIAIHPLVLLNISDFHVRLQAQASRDPCIGVCLGTLHGQLMTIENSFALKQATTTLDSAFLKTQVELYKQTFPTLEPVGVFVAASNSGMTAALSTFHAAVKAEYETCSLLLLLDTAALQSGASGTEIPLKVLDPTDTTSIRSLKWRLVTHEAERIAVDHVSRAANATLQGKKEEASEATRSKQVPDVILTPSEESDCTFLITQENALQVLRTRLQLLHRYVDAVQQGTLSGDPGILQRLNAILVRLPESAHVPNDATLQTEQEETAREVALVTLLSDMMALSTQMRTLASDVAKTRGSVGGVRSGLARGAASGGFEASLARHDMEATAAGFLYE
ncbi:hypothetical protein BCR37DRAFT_383047 [Protomyces lactucae-debilis]|uniref:COP9 signalosome complex subunit 6 n=1 Tax=Protomyces lactucae-debilis TaxID=2754530 RepID=A0A1Y2EZH7_PROLT|nr:uncharacterized protein BCR37DRAFT_383047 [Protomyces lactucae-debilis]ORY77041.1 hypothetical protein BCR37DRAFT_383047 [Protomyces lactucae-debilis]